MVSFTPMATGINPDGSDENLARIMLARRQAAQSGAGGKTAGASPGQGFAPTSNRSAALGYGAVIGKALLDNIEEGKQKRAQSTAAEEIAAHWRANGLPQATARHVIALGVMDPAGVGNMNKAITEAQFRAPQFLNVPPDHNVYRVDSRTGGISPPTQLGAPAAPAVPGQSQGSSAPRAPTAQQPAGGLSPVIAAQQPRAITDPQERASLGIPASDRRPYRMMPGGKTEIVDPSQPLESELEKQRFQGMGKRFNDIAADGVEANKDRLMVQRLSSLNSQVDPSGKTAFLNWIREKTGYALDANASNVQAYTGMLAYLAPRMRVPGSGTTSDRDLAKFEQSLPSLVGTAQGNKLVVETLGGMNAYREQAGRIAQDWQNGKLTAEQADEAIRALPDPFQQFRQFDEQANDPNRGAPLPPERPADLGMQGPAGDAPPPAPTRFRFNPETGQIE